MNEDCHQVDIKTQKVELILHTAIVLADNNPAEIIALLIMSSMLFHRNFKAPNTKDEDFVAMVTDTLRQNLKNWSTDGLTTQ